MARPKPDNAKYPIVKCRCGREFTRVKEFRERADGDLCGICLAARYQKKQGRKR